VAMTEAPEKVRAVVLATLLVTSLLAVAPGLSAAAGNTSGNTGGAAGNDGEVDLGPAGMAGDGSAEHPYVVTNVTQLQAIEQNLSATYALGDDIDAAATTDWNGGFDPVGTSGTPFTGTFDGQGHTIANLTVDRASENYVGLFGHSEGTISNVSLVESSIIGNDRTGGLVGESAGAVSNASANGTVDGSYFTGGLVGYTTGSVTASSAAGTVDGFDHTGGLVGWTTDSGSVSASTAAATVSAITAGGLVGYHDGSVTTSSASGTVAGTRYDGSYAGGLVGSNSGTVTTSYATGNVTGYTSGGLAGYASSFSSTTDSYWDTETSGRDTAVGEGADVRYSAGITTENMTGSRGVTNMPGLVSASTWLATGGYPQHRWAVDSLDLTVGSPLEVGRTTPATVTLSLRDGSTVAATTVATYTSNETGVVTVADDGTVTGVAPGTVTVNATQGATDTAGVAVEDTTAPTPCAGRNRTVDEDTHISLSGVNSTDNGTIDSYAWAFGDGATAAGENVTHTYADPGTYAVTLTVTDAVGNAATDGATVVVRDRTPPRPVTGDDTAVRVDATVQFDATDSTDNDAIESYAWTFGDGTTATGATPTHSYGQSGTYTATLTATDAAGNTASTVRNVTVRQRSRSNGGGGNDGDDDGGNDGGGDTDTSGGSTTGSGTIGGQSDDGPVVQTETTADRGTLRTNITVRDADAGAPVFVTIDSATDGVTTSPAPNVSVVQLGITLTERTDFTLNVTTAGRNDSSPEYDAFHRETGATDVGSVVVDHSLRDAQIANVSFRFRVRKSHVRTAELDLGTVALYRDEGDRWTELDTASVGETDEHYVFRARSPGFSTFVVGSTVTASDVTDADASATVDATTPDTATATQSPGTDSTPTAAGAGLGTWLPVGLLALLAGLVGLFVYGRKP
jgi:PKD repeat protein